MSYFDDHEDWIVHGLQPSRRPPRIRRGPLAKARMTPERLKELAAPPGSALARARVAAHTAFDPLWKNGPLNRRAAYEWLAIKMGLHIDHCHMVMFNEEGCARALAICAADPTCRAAQALANPINDFEDLDK